MICHIHDSKNKHVATGEGDNSLEALQEAADELEGDITRGSFGCGDSDDEAHVNASKTNTSSEREQLLETVRNIETPD